LFERQKKGVRYYLTIKVAWYQCAFHPAADTRSFCSCADHPDGVDHGFGCRGLPSSLSQLRRLNAHATRDQGEFMDRAMITSILVARLCCVSIGGLPHLVSWSRIKSSAQTAAFAAG
jgi:hypothetical protein